LAWIAWKRRDEHAWAASRLREHATGGAAGASEVNIGGAVVLDGPRGP
jgi:hypothetical protein